MAAASESQPVRLTNSTASVGIGQAGVAFVDLDVFFHAAELPSSASTLMPLAWARSTTRFVIAMFSSKASWLASIMTEL